MNAKEKRPPAERRLILLLVLFIIMWGFCGDAGGALAPDGGSGPGRFFGTVVAGGFRAVLIDYFWLRADILGRKKDYYGLRATWEALADLQPRAEDVWVYNSSNMAYDISAQYNTAAGRYAWVREGLAFGVKGLNHNPDSAAIRRHLANLFYFKFSYYANPYSREFRRLLLEDADKTFLRDPERASAPREALLYWEDLLAMEPDPQTHESRIWAAHSVLWEQEIGLREARLDMLEARERFLAADAGERSEYEKTFERRKREYEQALEAPPRITEAEAASLRRRIGESLESLRRSAGVYAADTGALAAWEENCRIVLAEIDRVLDACEAALDAIENPAAQGRAILTPEEIKTLETRDMGDILSVNSFYVAPIYAEAAARLKQVAGSREARSKREVSGDTFQVSDAGGRRGASFSPET